MHRRLANVNPRKFRLAVQKFTGDHVNRGSDIGTELYNAALVFAERAYWSIEGGNPGKAEPILDPIVTPNSFRAAFYFHSKGTCVEFRYGPEAETMAIDGLSDEHAKLVSFQEEIQRDLKDCMRY